MIREIIGKVFEFIAYSGIPSPRLFLQSQSKPNPKERRYTPTIATDPDSMKNISSNPLNGPWLDVPKVKPGLLSNVVRYLTLTMLQALTPSKIA